MEEPKDDIRLAAILGTHRHSIRKWRKASPRDCPKDRNPESWRKFLQENNLGPYSAQRNYGEDVEEAKKSALETVKEVKSDPEEWESAKDQGGEDFDEIATTMIILADALTRGKVTVRQYFDVGIAYIDSMRNKKARQLWIGLCLKRLAEMFSTPATAAKEFPEIVRWLYGQAARR